MTKAVLQSGLMISAAREPSILESCDVVKIEALDHLLIRCKDYRAAIATPSAPTTPIIFPCLSPASGATFALVGI